jgi:hypothetical protein
MAKSLEEIFGKSKPTNTQTTNQQKSLSSIFNSTSSSNFNNNIKQLIIYNPSNSKPQTAIFGLSDIPKIKEMSSNPEIASGQRLVQTGAGLVDVGSKFVQGTMNKWNEFTDLPFTRVPFQAAGAVTGLVSGAIGGLTGGVLETGKQAYQATQGKGFDVSQIGKTALDIGSETAGFGQQTGVQAAKIAPLGIAGKAITLPIVTSQLYEGTKELIKGEYLKGSIDLASGSLGAYFLPGTKGGFLLAPEFESSVFRKVGTGFSPQEAIGLTKIEETIMPGLNKAEVKAALEQGRVTRPITSRLFGKQPDIIESSARVTKAAQTIERVIPKADELAGNSPQMITAIKNGITKISTDLKPQMEQVPIKQETVQNINKSWADLKKQQIKEPDFFNYPGSKQAQAKFQNYLNQIKEPVKDPVTGQFRPRNLADLWQIRIDYDQSVPVRVKNATINSDANLQWQKDMWLQNREILNDTINDTATGLGKKSQQSFSDMSDLYYSKNNIESTFKLDTKGKPGVISPQTILKNTLKWGIASGLSLLGLEKLRGLFK